MKPGGLWWLPVGRAPEIDPVEFHRMLSSGQAVQVVDARTAMEYRHGTIGNARHAPLTEMPGSLESLDFDQEVPIVVLCLTGHRSLPGTRWLRAHGYMAFSLKGGVTTWNRAGYPTHPPSRSSG